MELNKIKKGERLSMTYYLETLSVSGDSIQVRDQNKMEFTIRGKSLIEGSIKSASQFSDTRKVSRTEMVDILLGAGDTVFTCEFTKADGSDRTLVGHLINTESHFGRSNVLDLEVTSGHPIRQVDHRTISSLVINDVKYTLKK
jgi:hypothetical protein